MRVNRKSGCILGFAKGVCSGETVEFILDVDTVGPGLYHGQVTQVAIVEFRPDGGSVQIVEHPSSLALLVGKEPAKLHAWRPDVIRRLLRESWSINLEFQEPVSRLAADFLSDDRLPTLSESVRYFGSEAKPKDAKDRALSTSFIMSELRKRSQSDRFFLSEAREFMDNGF